MKYGIIGAGNTGKAAAAYLLSQGERPLMWDRSQDRLLPLREKGLTATGKVEGHFSVDTTNRLEELAAQCDLLMLFTVAAGHRPVAERLAGHLRPGMILLVTNCCWGAVELDQVLGQEAEEKDVLIAETSGQLILCNSPATDAVYLKTIKESMILACTRPSQTDRALTALRPCWPQFIAGTNVLETSLASTNPVVHGPMALFNLARIENREDYKQFVDGMSRATTRYMEHIDAERVAVAAACGISIDTELELLNVTWGQQWSDLYTALHTNPSYQVTKGPVGLEHRFLTEDLPYGLAPLVQLGRKHGVATPYLCALLDVFGLAMDTDLYQNAPAIEKLDLSRYM